MEKNEAGNQHEAAWDLLIVFATKINLQVSLAEVQQLERSKWTTKTTKQRKVSFIRFFIFDFFYLFKLLKHSEYMIIYQVERLRNFDTFQNCQILKIC